MPGPTLNRLRVAAIDFLNPAPLLYSFEHEPAAAELRERYEMHYTSPAECAEQLRGGGADLGLIPIGALPFAPDLEAVPGCTIASLRAVRSIQLVVRPGLGLREVRTVFADRASRSSVAYTRMLFRAFYGNDPAYTQAPAALAAMLQQADAGLLIGDPALLALEARDHPSTPVEASFRDHTWYDVATLWRGHTGLPWVAAVWAVRPQALAPAGVTPTHLIETLTNSRDAGLTRMQTLVEDWSPRIAIPAETIRTYLTENIHYDLDPACLRAIERFYTLAAETGVLPPYQLRLLQT